MAMDAETLTALKKSIQHWRENVEAEDWQEASVDSFDCALCLLFAYPMDSKCAGCPVSDRTGTYGCSETPYYAARKAQDLWAFGTGSREAFREAAQAELDFLISLLPEGETA